MYHLNQIEIDLAKAQSKDGQVRAWPSVHPAQNGILNMVPTSFKYFFNLWFSYLARSVFVKHWKSLRNVES